MKPITDQPRQIVVLGAGGFLGSAMCKYLADAGHQVTAYWRHPNLSIARLPNVRSIVADIRDTWILADAIAGVDAVYHFASATHPSLFYTNPSAEYWEALQPLLVMMETAARSGVKKVVFPSSGGTIYADSSEPRTEQSPTDPRSPYAILKLTAEQLLSHAVRLGQFSVDIFRIGNPYGPSQRARPGQGVVPHWVAAIQQQAPIMVFGDGSAERDYVYIDDVCRLMALSLDRLDESDTFNLGSGQATSLTDLLDIVQSYFPKPHAVQYLPGRPSDVQSITLVTDRLLRHVPGFQFTSLSDGLQRTLTSHGLLSDSTSKKIA